MQFPFAWIEHSYAELQSLDQDTNPTRFSITYGMSSLLNPISENRFESLKKRAVVPEPVVKIL